MIEIEHLNKTYPSPGGDIHALRDVNLRIEDGEIFGIIGLSGAGKSTLVRCINLLERPTSGTVRIDGRDMTQLSRRDLLKARDGLMLGICNGFQALIKLGLVPYGEIRPITESDPTLTFNTIHRHQSMLVRTRVASNKSPWLSECNVDDEHLIAISHGEGRFIASDEQIKALAANGQIATQYTDLEGNPTYDSSFNPNGSSWAVEGITSPDGRVLGKMGHTERSGANIAKNISGNKAQPLFESGVKYFKG